MATGAVPSGGAHRVCASSLRGAARSSLGRGFTAVIMPLMSARRLAAFAFLIAAAVRIAALSLSDQYVTALKQQVEVRNVAITLARTGDFANPYFVPTGKTAHLAPIAPFLTSLVYRTWGVTDRAEFVRGVVCSLCSALACGLTVLFRFRSRTGPVCVAWLACWQPWRHTESSSTRT